MRSLEGAFLVVSAMALGVVVALWILLVFDVSGSGVAAAILLALLLAGCVIVGAIVWTARTSALRLRDSDGNRFNLTRDSIAHVVRQAAAEVPGVDTVSPAFSGGSRGISIECIAQTQPPYNPMDVRRRLRSHLRDRVAAITGIEVGRVTVAFEGLPFSQADEYP
jgi:hypothetical protein